MAMRVSVARGALMASGPPRNAGSSRPLRPASGTERTPGSPPSSDTAAHAKVDRVPGEDHAHAGRQRKEAHGDARQRGSRGAHGFRSSTERRILETSPTSFWYGADSRVSSVL